MVAKTKYTILVDVIGLSLLCIAMLRFAWVGHLGSDDQVYINAAQGWIESFPYVGQSHLTLRNTLIFPVAICFRLFGIGEFTSILPSIIYYVAIVILSYVILRYLFDRKTGLIAALLLLTSPLFAVNGTICGKAST